MFFKKFRKDCFIHMIACYNEQTDSVDIELDSLKTLRLCCQKIFPTVSTTPRTYELMVNLARNKPILFAEMALDQCLESYLNNLI